MVDDIDRRESLDELALLGGAFLIADEGWRYLLLDLSMAVWKDKNSPSVWAQGIWQRHR